MSPMSNWEFPKDCPKLKKYKRQAALGPGKFLEFLGYFYLISKSKIFKICPITVSSEFFNIHQKQL